MTYPHLAPLIGLARWLTIVGALSSPTFGSII